MTRLVLFISWATLAAVCGSSFEATVSGNVKLDGKPLTKGNVSFVPIGPGTVANGAIDESGNYVLHTSQQQGLPAGRCKVTVVATDPPPPGKQEAPGVLLTPARYGSVKTTPLEKDVQPGANVFNLDLSSKPQ